MERLTKRDTDGQAMMDCEKCEADWTGKHGKPMADCTALYCRNRLLDRLAEYEDTEETLRQLCRNCDLERLEKLAEADKDGRLVVLPCKVGQRVFALLDTDKHISECEVKQNACLEKMAEEINEGRIKRKHIKDVLKDECGVVFGD